VPHFRAKSVFVDSCKLGGLQKNVGIGYRATNQSVGKLFVLDLGISNAVIQQY
jgi:hypothetical protein